MDQNLTQLRDQIDGIDQKLVELFKQRMAVSRQVAAYKQEHGLPTLDVSRERALLAKVGSLAGEDLADYTVNGKTIPYHLIDICDPGYKYNVFEYQHDFFRAYETIRKKGKLPILCGGTGMYIEAVLKGYRLLDVPQNPGLRESLKDKSLPE